MRIGSVDPRINGINLRGLGSFDLPSNVAFDLNVFMVNLRPNMEHGMAATPDMVRQSLISRVRDVCAANSPAYCDPSSVSGLIEQAVATYTDAYNRVKSDVANQVSSGQIATPVDYVPPIYMPGTSNQPANALDRITPAYTPVVKAPETNVLNPPQGSGPVSGQNSGTFTGTSTTTQRPGDTGKTEDGGIPLWVFAAAGLGLLFMMGRHK